MCYLPCMWSIDQRISSLIAALTVGIGSCPTNHHSGPDQLLSFNDRSTSLGERCSGYSRWFIPPVVREIGGHIRTETGSLDLSHGTCRRWSHMWSQPSYVTVPVRLC